MTLLERLRELSCSDKLTQGELDTVMQAIRHIDSLQKEVRAQLPLVHLAPFCEVWRV